MIEDNIQLNELVDRWIEEVLKPANKMRPSKTLSTRELRANLSHTIAEAKYGNVPHIITHHNRPYAVVVSIEIQQAVLSSKSILNEFSKLSGLSGDQALESIISYARQRQSGQSITL